MNVSKWTVFLAIAVALIAAVALTGGVQAQTDAQATGVGAGNLECPMGGYMGVGAQHRGGGRGIGGGMGLRMGATASLVTVAAEKLGMTVEELLAELGAGKTIEEVAEAKGVDVAGIIDAVLELRAERLKELVDAGTITQEQADAMLAQMRTQLEEHVTEVHTPRGGMGSGPGRGGGGGGGRGGRP